MILITTGTTGFPFQRMLDLAGRVAKDNPRERVVVQKGTGKLEARGNLEATDYLNYERLVKLIKQARLVICHGGPASIFLCWQAGKKPLVMPRRKQYGEHVNDHQVHFAKYLKQKKMIELAEDWEEGGREVGGKKKFKQSFKLLKQGGSIKKITRELDRWMSKLDNEAK